MTKTDFIKETQKNGWRLHWNNANGLMFVCGYQGCRGHHRVEDWEHSPIPERCGLTHVNGYAAPAVHAYTDLVDELRRKRHLLGLSMEDLSAAAGLADGHINKLESDARTAMLPTLIIWAESLGFEITLTPAPVPMPVLRLIERKAGRSTRAAVAGTGSRSAGQGSDPSTTN